MQFSNPAFIIPWSNNKVSKKHWWWDYPKYYWNLKEFEDIKSKRISETNSILESIKSSSEGITDDGNNVYFEISFHEKVKSKSSIPSDLLNSNHISLYWQTYKWNYLAVCSENNFQAFNNQIKKIELKPSKVTKEYSKESAYLSTISWINTISKDEILQLEDKWKEKDRIPSYIHISNSLWPSELEEIYERINILDNNSNAEILELTSWTKIIYWNFASSFIDKISTPHPKNPIHKVEQWIMFKVSKQINIPYKLEDISIKELELDSQIAVFDSWIQQNSFLDPYIIDRVNYSSEPHNDWLWHWTFVWSRIIYWADIKDQILSKKELSPKNKLLDVKIFDSKWEVSDKIILDALNWIVEKYPEVTIFNLSLNSPDNTDIHKWRKSTLTREIDKISYKYKKIIIISAWNHDSYSKIKYPKCLLVNEAVITPPADTINWLSVWSIASQSSTRSIAKNKEVSPFSRCWIDSLYKKPDLVHFWWNLDIYGTFDGIWESWLSNDSMLKIAENIWTSFSAPLVSWIAWNIYSYLTKTWMITNKIDMTKALLLHSARYNIPSGSEIKDYDKNKLVWFWVPDFWLAFDNSSNSAMYLYEWVLKNFENTGIDNENKHKVKFTIPEELKQEWKELRVRCTLVYTSDIAICWDLDYVLSDIKMNFHYINSEWVLKTASLPNNSDDDYRIDWNPIKHFEKRIKSRGYQSWEWEIWLTLNLRWDLDGTNYEQPYALVISIEDISPDLSQRTEIWNIIREKYRQYISLEIKQKVLVK